MSPVKKLYKSKKKKWLTLDIYGPIKYRPKKGHKLDASYSLGGSYILNIPKENNRQWKTTWQGQKVTIVGAYSVFRDGKQIVCVNNPKLGDFAAPIHWLKEDNTPVLCTCPTATIWAKGCQCGGA